MSKQQTRTERREAAEHIKKMLGHSSPIVKRLALDLLAEPEWTQEPPTEQGEYWHWTGNPEEAPLPTFVMYSGFTGKCFVSIGQLGNTQPCDCDTYGGWWFRLNCPQLPVEASP
jgi:hypothetical protein